MARLTVELGGIGGLCAGRVRELPECFAIGDTLDEMMENMRDSIRLRFITEGKIDDVSELPLPTCGMIGGGGRYEIHLDSSPGPCVRQDPWTF